ncbi:MAG: hypothetical protein J0M33_11555 [Anaerolineae bacterium]|nr:hypothetical protein [Anaerolineae bacterium]
MAELLPKRMRYFDGQFLTEKDFQEEQDYLLNRHHIHSRSLHTSGIAEGLTIASQKGDARLVIEAGVALNREGQEIVLPDQFVLEQASLNAYPKQRVLVVLSYHQEATDIATKGKAEPTRYTEIPKVELVPVTDGWPTNTTPAEQAEPRLNEAGRYIRLALITISARTGNAVTLENIDLSVRTFAGTNIRGEIELSRLYLTSDGLPPERRPSLSVRQITPTGAAAPVTNAYLSGSLQVSIGLTVDGAVNAQQIQTNSLNITDQIRWGNGSIINSDQGGSIDLGGNNSVAGIGTPYIDFHFLGKTEDFNTRIINDADGRLTIAANAVLATGSLHVGPQIVIGSAEGRISVSGKSAEISVARRTLVARPASLGAGDRFVWYNPDGEGLRLWTDTVGDVMSISKSSKLGIGTTDPKAAAHIVGDSPILAIEGKGNQYTTIDWYPKGVGNGRKGWIGFFGNDLSLAAEESALNLFTKNGVIIYKDNNWSGNLAVQGNLSFGTTARQMISLWGTEYGIGVQSNTTYFRTWDNFAWFKRGSHANGIFDSGGGTTMMVLDNRGYLGIGVTNPNATLEVSGSAVFRHPNKPFTVNISYGDFVDLFSAGCPLYINNNGLEVFIRTLRTARSAILSSRESKENISAFTIAEAEDLLASLECVHFVYKDDHSQSSQLGFIAEDAPEPIASPDHESINPMSIITVLTRVLQQQQVTIQAIENRLAQVG